MFRVLSKAVGICGYIIQYGCITHCTLEYIGDFVVCSGPSMEPTLYTDNVLLTERISSRFNRINRGDIIIAKSPSDPVTHICKRVVGLPGDRIVIRPSLNPFSNKFTKKSSIEYDEINKNFNNKKDSNKNEYIVPRGHIWIEGDNSENSSDSRYYGPIPQGLVRSRALLRLWPFPDFKLLI